MDAELGVPSGWLRLPMLLHCFTIIVLKQGAMPLRKSRRFPSSRHRKHFHMRASSSAWGSFTPHTSHLAPYA